MRSYSKEEIGEMIARAGIFVPSNVVLAEMIRRKEARRISGSKGILSEERFLVEPDGVIKAANVIVNQKAILCVPTASKTSMNYPKIDETFEALIRLSKKQIVLVAPFISDRFIDDMGRVLSEKTAITTIVTCSPAGKKPIHAKLIAACRKKGYSVKTTELDLHAKIYLFDGKAAMLGSSNLTRFGFFDNYELDVLLFGDNCNPIEEIISELKAKPAP